MKLSQYLTASAFLLTLPFFGCGGSVVTTKTPTIYMAGYQRNTSSVISAYTWTTPTSSSTSTPSSGTATSLTAPSGTTNPWANSIAVSGSDVYVVGYQNTGKDVAMVWKNGTATSLTDGTQYAIANSIAISGSDVYIAGVQASATTGYYIATLWKNGTAGNLTDGSTNAVASAVLVQ